MPCRCPRVEEDQLVKVQAELEARIASGLDIHTKEVGLSSTLRSTSSALRCAALYCTALRCAAH